MSRVVDVTLKYTVFRVVEVIGNDNMSDQEAGDRAVLSDSAVHNSMSERLIAVRELLSQSACVVEKIEQVQP